MPSRIQRATKVLRQSRKTIILVLVIIMITLVASTTISIWIEKLEGVHVPSIGTLNIVGFEAYGGDLKNKTGQQYLDWGRVDTGSSTNRSFFIQSKIDNTTSLNLTTGNWTFLGSDNLDMTRNVLDNLTTPLADFMNVTWDYDARPIPKGGVVNVTLTLRISGDYSFISALYVNQVQGFSFDINIEPNK